MKFNRFAALAAIALLVVGAMSLASARSFAQTSQLSAPQVQVTAAPETEKAGQEQTETIAGADVEEGAEASGQTESGPDEQSPTYSASITVDQNATEGMSESDESAALAGQAKITADAASAAALAANPGATVVKVELDNENGALVYSVELNNGTDVKVDAGNGVILHTETDGENN